MGCVKLRGQEVLLDHETKTLCFRIFKPLVNAFSISDSIKHYVDKGYKVQVCLGEKRMEINHETPFTRKEEVKSKFKDTDPWHRYWYVYSDNRQKELFKVSLENSERV